MSEIEGQQTVLEAVKYFGPKKKLIQIHFRDVCGTLPAFKECFLGEGNFDPAGVMVALRDYGFDAPFRQRMCQRPCILCIMQYNYRDNTQFVKLLLYSFHVSIKALAAPYTMVRFMPTGGVNQDNLKDYLSCDEVIACGGSWMVKEDFIRAGAFEKPCSFVNTVPAPTSISGYAAVIRRMASSAASVRKVTSAQESPPFFRAVLRRQNWRRQ